MDDYAGWQIWRGSVNGLWHAKLSGSAKPLLLHDNTREALQEQISLWVLAAWGSRETWAGWPGAGGHGPACAAVGVLPVRRPAP